MEKDFAQFMVGVWVGFAVLLLLEKVDKEEWTKGEKLWGLWCVLMFAWLFMKAF